VLRGDLGMTTYSPRGSSRPQPDPDSQALSKTTEPSPATQALLVSAREAAGLLGVHRATIYDLLSREELQSVKIGRRRLIPRDSLTDFIARNSNAGLD